MQINKQDAQESSSLYSFEPEIISESEERERLTALAQRDFLIKSYGILEQIYMAMKKNGTLRSTDERKYGLYGRLAHTSTNHSACSFPHRFYHQRNGYHDSTQDQCYLKGNEVINNPSLTENSFVSSFFSYSAYKYFYERIRWMILLPSIESFFFFSDFTHCLERIPYFQLHNYFFEA